MENTANTNWEGVALERAALLFPCVSLISHRRRRAFRKAGPKVKIRQKIKEEIFIKRKKKVEWEERREIEKERRSTKKNRGNHQKM